MLDFPNEMLKEKVLSANVTGSVLYISRFDSRKGLAFSQLKLTTLDRLPEMDIATGIQDALNTPYYPRRYSQRD
jgi:hypothetical protein